MRDIIIHIGHGKTGSSAIQAFLAKNSALLKTHGVEYHYHESLDRAEQGGITSGNGQLLLEADTIKSGLYSSETLFNDIQAGSAIAEKIRQQASDISIICYTRDLFDHYVSSWGQYIKRGKGVLQANDYAAEYRLFPKLEATLALLEEMGCDIVLKNYSRIDDLEGSFIDILLGENSSEFLASAERLTHRVNRSLTLAEYEVQRLFNKHYAGRTNRFVSDPLVEQLPAIRSEKPQLSADAIDVLLKNNGAAIDAINQRLQIEEAIDVSYNAGEDNVEDNVFTFTGDQLAVLIASVAEAMEKSGGILGKADVNTLRNVALAIESAETLGLPDALALMKIAQRSRPDGHTIKNKVKRWERQLKAAVNE